MKNKTILCTGSQGFIGKRLVPMLVKQGYNVIEYDKKLGQDTSDKEKLESYFKNMKIDYVIHMSAYLGNELLHNIKSNIIGTKNIIKLCKKYNIKKISFCSSAAVYGNSKNAFETDYLAPINFYGIAKKYCEKLIRKGGTSYIILRLSNVFGKGGNGIISKLCEKSYPVITSPLYYSRDFVAVQDVCNAIVKSINTKIINETFNISSGKETTLGQLDEMFPNATVDIKKKREITWSCLNNNRAKMLLKWQPKITLKRGIDDYNKL